MRFVAKGEGQLGCMGGQVSTVRLLSPPEIIVPQLIEEVHIHLALSLACCRTGTLDIAPHIGRPGKDRLPENI